MLLQFGGDTTALDGRGSNIMHRAAGYNSGDTLRVILTWKAGHPDSTTPGIDDLDMMGETALHLACRYNKVEGARLLLENGADINAAGPGHLTPLAWIASIRILRVIDRVDNNMLHFLLSRSANVNGRTTHTKQLIHFNTPLHYAIHWR
jgi:ankyrin repeat protein